MRKNMVMDLIYRGFIYAANYSESHYNPRRSQIKIAPFFRNLRIRGGLFTN